VGQFNLGSTIVIVFEAPNSFKFKLTPNQTIKLGQSLGCLSSDEIFDSGVEREE